MIKLTMMFQSCIVFLFIISIYGSDVEIGKSRPEACIESGTELIHEEETYLYLSTLNGTFIAVNQRNGDIIWQFKEEAVVKVPANNENTLMPVFLPDPRDGSLYLLSSEKNSDLKKLQFTIQQLVTSSPCRSTDGIFYTGKKVDNWFLVDWRTGVKEELGSSTSADETCPLSNRNSLFLGRTEYNLIIHDITRSERKWNVTYYDYTTKIISPEKLKSHDFLYFAGSSTGKFSAIKNSVTNNLIWEADFGSPVIGIYLRDGDGLVSLPFTTMDDNSMPSLNQEFTKHIKLSSTLYIGAHSHGLYALPAYATSNSEVLLLNGPTSTNSIPVSASNEYGSSDLIGYYDIPAEKTERLMLSGRNDAVIEMSGSAYAINASSTFALKNIATQTEEKLAGEGNLDGNMLPHLVKNGLDYALSWNNIELKIFTLMFTTMLCMFIFMFIYFRAQVKVIKQSSSSGYLRSTSSSGTITALAEELPDGSTKVGKISFHSKDVLGKGCEGTFVFKGEFDNRKVAVKRLLPECFTVADREVCLLRESDQHPNVIRYFCMEQDKQFRYIALELCKATLQEYIERRELANYITSTEILAQATAGLEHLHTLNIVHRDIKPQNVLLSIPCSTAKEIRVRAMISDFGLCKKLQIGKASFSRKSGVTGTDGWIAPEMIHGRSHTTTAVDVFSLGCVFYYALSNGKHPFGDSFSRQANIMTGAYKLNDIKDPYNLWNHIISKMVNLDPQERPSVSIIRNHPAFWSKDHILTFLQDVSDRIEKEDNTSRILMELETGSSIVLKNDWRDMIEPEIAGDLRKYRTYRSDSVRDLLRALRNKKHHYRELSEAVRQILGSLPDQFVTYWMDRFPMLLLHTWLAMQCVQNEEVFQKYYCDSYKFPCIYEGVPSCWLQTAGNSSPRWSKCPNKNSPKSNSPYEKRTNTPFFSMSNSHKTLNWRIRPKATTENQIAMDSIIDAENETSNNEVENENEKETTEIIVEEEINDENVGPEGADDDVTKNKEENEKKLENGPKKRRSRHRPKKKHTVTFESTENTKEPNSLKHS